MVDGYDGYQAIVEQNQLARLGCWAHARRYFVDAQRLQPKGKTGKADQALAFIKSLYAIEKHSKRKQPGRKIRGVDYTTRQAYIIQSLEGRTMPMVKKSISVTDQQDNWIKAQIETGHFGNESEVVRELIRERQIREQETPEEIAAIRAALVEGEKSGFSDRSVDEIWEEAKARHKSKHA